MRDHPDTSRPPPPPLYLPYLLYHPYLPSRFTLHPAHLPSLHQRQGPPCSCPLPMYNPPSPPRKQDPYNYFFFEIEAQNVRN